MSGKDVPAGEVLRAMGLHPQPLADVSPSTNGAEPMIETSNRPMREISDDALAAVVAANTPPKVFVRGGALTRVRRDEGERPIVEHVAEAELRGRLARVALFAKTEKKVQHIAPPLEIVRDLIALGTWPALPPLEGITEAPSLRADGTVLRVPGYDPPSRLVYMPARGLIIPEVSEQPTVDDRTRALGLLLEAVHDFPFADDADRANALALMLTPIVRPAISGQVPLALIDATKAGTGKGLLISLAAQIATGRPAAMLTAPVREEEWQKTLLAVIARGSTFIAIDEVSELRSPSLAAAVTAPSIEGRLLGRSEMVQVPQRATWSAAGNNVRVAGDLGRRCYWIRLDAKTSRPWRRTAFRHPNLPAWAAAARGELLAALLTLARAWFAAGRPAGAAPPLGGFDEWASTIAGILDTAGVEGFLGNLETFYEQADQESGEWEIFLAALRERYGDDTFTLAELAEHLQGELREALPDDLASALDKSPASLKSKVGKALSKRTGTRFGDHGLRVEKVSQNTRSKAFSWRVERDAELAGVQGSQRSGSQASYAKTSQRRSDAETPATPVPLQTGEEPR